MPVPKKKTSKSRRNMRRAHLALDVTQFSICKNCNAPHLSHSVCESCGHYKGRFLDKKLLQADLRVQTP